MDSDAPTTPSMLSDSLQPLSTATSRSRAMPSPVGYKLANSAISRCPACSQRSGTHIPSQDSSRETLPPCDLRSSWCDPEVPASDVDRHPQHSHVYRLPPRIRASGHKDGDPIGASMPPVLLYARTYSR